MEVALADGFIDIPEEDRLVRLASVRIPIAEHPGWRYLTVDEFNRLAEPQVLTLEEQAAVIRPDVKKHADHNQKDHGNWAKGPAYTYVERTGPGPAPLKDLPSRIGALPEGARRIVRALRDAGTVDTARLLWDDEFGPSDLAFDLGWDAWDPPYEPSRQDMARAAKFISEESRNYLRHLGYGDKLTVYRGGEISHSGPVGVTLRERTGRYFAERSGVFHEYEISMDDVLYYSDALWGHGTFDEKEVGVMGDVLRAKVTKHADHDQSTHGNWSDGPSPDPTPDTSYRGSHQPSPTYGAPAHDLSILVSPDIYDHPEWYFSMHEPYNRDGARIIQSLRNRPDAELKVYRAVPSSADETTLTPGDWVTTVPSYARLHGESNLGGTGNYKIITQTVKARDLVWPGDSMVEFGWFPDNNIEEEMQEEMGVEKSSPIAKVFRLFRLHYPGGHDHDQKRHGRRGGTTSSPASPSTTTTRTPTTPPRPRNIDAVSTYLNGILGRDPSPREIADELTKLGWAIDEAGVKSHLAGGAIPPAPVTPPSPPSPPSDSPVEFLGRTARFSQGDLSNWTTKALPVPEDPSEALAQVKEMGDYYRDLADAYRSLPLPDPAVEALVDEDRRIRALIDMEIDMAQHQARQAAKVALPALLARGESIASEIDAHLATLPEVSNQLDRPGFGEREDWARQYLDHEDEDIRKLAKKYLDSYERMRSINEGRNDAYTTYLVAKEDYRTEVRRVHYRTEDGVWVETRPSNVPKVSTLNGMTAMRERTFYYIPEDLLTEGRYGPNLARGKSVAALGRLSPAVLIQTTTEWEYRGWADSSEPVFPAPDSTDDYRLMASEAAANGERVITLNQYTNLLADEVTRLDKSATRLLSTQKSTFDLLHRKVSEVEHPRADRAVLSVLERHREFGGEVATIHKRSKGKTVLDAESDFFPTDWIERSSDFGPIQVEVARTRAHYDHLHWNPDRYSKGTIGKIKVSASLSDDDLLHEMGHRFESTIPEVIALEEAFYLHRTNDASDPLVPMSTLLPNHGYRRDERSRPDDFTHPYMGKPYVGASMGGGVRHPYRRERIGTWDNAYELLSMGLPRVYGRSGSEPFSGSNDLDPEMLNFILGLLVEA